MVVVVCDEMVINTVWNIYMNFACHRNTVW